MAPFPQLVPFVCGMGNVACFANMTRVSNATSFAVAASRPVETTPVAYYKDAKRPALEPMEFIFAICFLCAFVGVIVGGIIFKSIRRAERTWRPRPFTGFCYSLMRAAFFKIRDCVRRPESAPDAGESPAVTDGASAADAERKDARQ